MKIVVTGASGFVGRNLISALKYQTKHQVFAISRETDLTTYSGMKVDCVFHLAGANRPETEESFDADNVDYAQEILSVFKPNSVDSKFLYASSVHVGKQTPYARSKKTGEELVQGVTPSAGWCASILRLPNLFGKWCRPHYNSFVATFIAQTIEGEEITVFDRSALVNLLYIDDLVNMLLGMIETVSPEGISIVDDFPSYEVSVGQVADLLNDFSTRIYGSYMPDVEKSFEKKLHATYLSYLNQDDRVFNLQGFTSDTGSFCEVFKKSNFGQVSVLTIEPGATRGNHFHDTKCENFYLAQGTIKFSESDTHGGGCVSRSISNGMSFWTRPGWFHTIENEGEKAAVLIIWANEIFDQDLPDTYSALEN